MDNKKTLEGMYASGESERESYIDRALQSAEVTIPSLFPDVHDDYNTTFRTPHQTVGARGVNNLASKLLLTLLPPNTPFFRFRIDENQLSPEELQNQELIGEVELALSAAEQAIMKELETSKVRISSYDVFRQLLVAGNVVLYVPPKDDIRVHYLQSYVAKRDGAGNLLHLIIKEKIAFAALPEEVQSELMSREEKDKYHPEKDVSIFTGVIWNGKTQKWDVSQEVGGVVLKDSVGTYAKDANPYMVLRFSKVDGESYGRGFVEEYIGDLIDLDALREAIVLGSKLAAKAVFMVRPGAATDIRLLRQAKSGDLVKGNPEDVQVLRVEKNSDFSVAEQLISSLTQEMSLAFLLNSAVQRNAERVTATEIRLMVEELEQTLGGVYSLLSQEFQLPLVNALMKRMQKGGRIPDLPKGLVNPTVVTGIEALGRGSDLNKINIFVEQVTRIMGPEALASIVNLDTLIVRIASAVGMDPREIVKPKEQIEAERQQAQQQQLIQQAAPGVVQEITKQAGQAINQQE